VVVAAATIGGPSEIACRGLIFWEVSPTHSLQGFHSACALGVCGSSAQCKDDEASDKTDLRHEHADTPKLKSVPECVRKRC